MKRVTDNFKLLRELLPETPDSDTFWSIRIIGRKKDNPSLEKNSKLYKSYTVACAADLDALAPKIAKCSITALLTLPWTTWASKMFHSTFHSEQTCVVVFPHSRLIFPHSCFH